MRWSEHGEGLYRESELKLQLKIASLRWFVAGAAFGAALVLLGVLVAS